MRIKRMAIDCISVEMNLNELHIAEGKAVMFLEMPEAFSVGVDLFDAYLPKEVSESADHIAEVSTMVRVVENVEQAKYADMCKEDQDALKAVGWKGREYCTYEGQWVDDDDDLLWGFIIFRTKLPQEVTEAEALDMLPEVPEDD